MASSPSYQRYWRQLQTFYSDALDPGRCPLNRRWAAKGCQVPLLLTLLMDDLVDWDQRQTVLVLFICVDKVLIISCFAYLMLSPCVIIDSCDYRLKSRLVAIAETCDNDFDDHYLLGKHTGVLLAVRLWTWHSLITKVVQLCFNFFKTIV